MLNEQNYTFNFILLFAMLFIQNKSTKKNGFIVSNRLARLC